METNFISIFTDLLQKITNQIQKINNFGLAASILFHLIGFFVGNIASTWLSLFFEWNGLAAFAVLLIIEVLSIIEYSSISKTIWFFQYTAFFKRGFFFGLLADGFKVGS